MSPDAEHKNGNSNYPTFGVMALRTLKIVISVIYCVHSLSRKLFRDIFLKLYANVYHYDTI